MAVPPASALLVNTIPFSRVITQAEFNGGTFSDGVANEVWLKYNTTIKITFGSFITSGGTFTPSAFLFQSDGVTVIKSVPYPAAWYVSISSAGTYYLRIRRAAGGASNFDFTVNIDTRPLDSLSYSDGDFVVNDDSNPYPACLIGSDGSVKSYLSDFPAGEIATINNQNNKSIWHDRFGHKAAQDTLALFDGGLNYLTSTSRVFSHPQFPLLGSGGSNFYAVDGVLFDCYKIDPTSGADTLLGNLGARPECIAIDNSETTLYWIPQTNDGFIHRLSLPTLAPLASIPVGSFDIVNERLGRTPNNWPGDIHVLDDGTLVTWKYRNPTNEYSVVVISPGGATTNFPLGPGTNYIDHLAKIKGSITQIYIWLLFGFLDSGTFASFNLSTGVITPILNTKLFSFGINLVNNDPTIFGPSESCQFVRLASLAPPTTPPSLYSGIYRIVPNKRQDTLWTQDFAGTANVKIPNLFAKTALIGE